MEKRRLSIKKKSELERKTYWDDLPKFTRIVLNTIDIGVPVVVGVGAIGYGVYNAVKTTAPVVISNVSTFCSECYQQVAPYIESVFNS